MVCLHGHREIIQQGVRRPQTKIAIGPRKACDMMGGVSPKASCSSWSTAVPLDEIVYFYKFWWLRLFHEKSRIHLVYLRVGGCVSDELKGIPIAHGAAHCDGTPVPGVTVSGGVYNSWKGVRKVWECSGSGFLISGGGMELHLDLVLTFTSRCTERHPSPPASAPDHAIWSL